MIVDLRELVRRKHAALLCLDRLKIEVHDVRFDQIGEKQMRE